MKTNIKLLWSKEDTVVRLSEGELWKLRQLARYRLDPKVAAGVVNQKVCDKPALDVHLMGLMGEYAVATYFGEPMDLSIDLGGDENGTDLYLGPWTTSVKYATYHPPYLKFDTLAEFHQDIAVLTGPGPLPECVALYGWTTPERFRDNCEQRDFKHGLRFYVGPDRLSPMQGLKALLYDAIKCPGIRSWWGGSTGNAMKKIEAGGQ